MNVASFDHDSTYRIGYSIPENSQFARPGSVSDYTHIQVLPTGHAYFTGDGATDNIAISGASPATTSLGELVILRQRSRHGDAPPSDNTHYTGFDPYGVEGFVGNPRGQMIVSTINVLDLVNSFLSTPPIGLRRYQLLLQENVTPIECGPAAGRFRVLIQTYQLMVYPQAGMVNLRSAHLSVSPDGRIREQPFDSMLYSR